LVLVNLAMPQTETFAAHQGWNHAYRRLPVGFESKSCKQAKSCKQVRVHGGRRVVACGVSARARARGCGSPPRPNHDDRAQQGWRAALVYRVEAEDEVTLAFRISGRLLKNDGNLGDRVQPGQVLAKLEPQNELNTLRQAQAGLAAAQGQLTQARNHFDRQETLLGQGWTTRANFDVATQALQTAQSQVDAAEAQLKSAHDLVSFTELKADAPGVITGIGPSAGEVVQAGQMIARLARQDGRDAVFDVPAQLIRSAPTDPQITVSLTDDPTVTARGRVREVAAQANFTASRVFVVRSTRQRCRNMGTAAGF